MWAPHPPWAADPFRDSPETLNALEPPSRAEGAEISPAVLAPGSEEAGPKGAQPGSHSRRRADETAESDGGGPRIAQQIALAFGIPINKDVVRRILAVRYQPGPDSTGPSWLTVLGHTKDSLWSLDLFRCESAILRTHWVLVVMDQCTRRIVGFAVHRGVVDGVGLCRMFNRATRGQGRPRYLSSDHDPLYRFHQWQANLRILDVTEVKAVPSVSNCCQAATGSRTRSRQWETHCRWLKSAGATVCPRTNVSGVWPFNDAWQRAVL